MKKRFIPRKMFIYRNILGALLIFCLAAVGNLKAAERPNIILFLVDDLGWQDTSVPFWTERTPFNDHFHTPNMERLAKQGILLTDAYSCAVCSPSRTSLMTGQNAARHGVTNWTLTVGKDQSKGSPKHISPPDWNLAGLQPGSPTLASLLQDSGYETIHCGKAHWGAIGTEGEDPRNLGFTVNIAGHAAGGLGHYHGQKNFGNKPGEHTRPWGVPGMEKYHGKDIHLTDALTIEAQAAVKDAVKKEKPFFLYMAHYAVHTPIQPHKRFVDRYLGKKYPGTDIDIPEVEANYASMVEGFDASLGELMKTVDELGVAENTLLIFTSDNGGLSHLARGMSPKGTPKNTHCWPLREGKGSAFEGGTRVPWLASWVKPNKENKHQADLPLEPGYRSNVPVIIEDLFPTILSITDVAIPKDHIVDGENMIPILTGELTKREEPRPLIFHYPHQWVGRPSGGYQPHSSIRLGEWKAIYFYELDRWFLYNLEHSVMEDRDLCPSQGKIMPGLAKRLQDLLKERGALLPVRREDGKPHEILPPYERREPKPEADGR